MQARKQGVTQAQERSVTEQGVTEQGVTRAQEHGVMEARAGFAGREVNRIGYGAMQLSRLAEDRAAAVRMVRRAVELGVEHVDTAQFYGDGFVNGVLAEALRPEDGVMIVSKIGAEANPGGSYRLRPAQRPEQLRRSVEDNCAALGVERIPVVNLRRMDVPPSPIMPEGDQVVDVEDQLAELVALREEGKIGAVGLSAVSEEVLRRALPAGIVCVQNAYSLVDRRDERVLDLCTERGVAWVPYFPLGGAVPQLPKVTELPEVIAAARAHGRTPAQIGLAWLLHRAPNVHLIPGTADPEHLAANMAAATITTDQLPRFGARVSGS
jgi:pyridoxine 4-dehydrogenase